MVLWSGARDCKVTLQGPESGGQQAIVWLRGYPDFWLAFFAPSRQIVVTPKLVRRMIQQALAQGWEPTQQHPTEVS